LAHISGAADVISKLSSFKAYDLVRGGDNTIATPERLQRLSRSVRSKQVQSPNEAADKSTHFRAAAIPPSVSGNGG
jgi:hypothetical protein